MAQNLRAAQQTEDIKVFQLKGVRFQSFSMSTVTAGTTASSSAAAPQSCGLEKMLSRYLASQPEAPEKITSKAPADKTSISPILKNPVAVVLGKAQCMPGVQCQP